MTDEQLSDLTPREAALMRVLTDMLGSYRAAGQREAANAMSQAMSRAWQTLKPGEPWPDTAPDPDPLPIEPRFRTDDSKAMLARLIDKLPEPHRQIMRLSRLETWTDHAIAAEVGLASAEDVKRERGVAGDKLRELLAAAGGRKV